jgi:hypothetical protein
MVENDFNQFLCCHFSLKKKYTENQELHDFTQERLDAVQIKPQKVKFNLRKGNPKYSN